MFKKITKLLLVFMMIISGICNVKDIHAVEKLNIPKYSKYELYVGEKLYVDTILYQDLDSTNPDIYYNASSYRFTYKTSDSSTLKYVSTSSKGNVHMPFLEALKTGTVTVTATCLNPDDNKNTEEDFTFTVTIKKFPFTDVTSDYWGRFYIEDASHTGLMTGATAKLFKPYAYMNRAMIATVIYRMEGEPEVTYKKQFSDVKDGEYYSKAVTWCKNNGVINGYADGTFRPLNNITRQELAQMLNNYAKYKQLDDCDLGSGRFFPILFDNEFEDSDTVSPWHKEAMVWAYRCNIIKGFTRNDKQYAEPLKTATRAECAKMLMVFYNIYFTGELSRMSYIDWDNNRIQQESLD